MIMKSGTAECASAVLLFGFCYKMQAKSTDVEKGVLVNTPKNKKEKAATCTKRKRCKIQVSPKITTTIQLLKKELKLVETCFGACYIEYSQIVALHKEQRKNHKKL